MHGSLAADLQTEHICMDCSVYQTNTWKTVVTSHTNSDTTYFTCESSFFLQHYIYERGWGKGEQRKRIPYNWNTHI